ncbi:NLP/P60 protein [Ruminiclostridium papyrosolvens DSM 2782]|uniref:NLP/P60 protein n=1 Tax=Ruminiclostridium papyrosolvens DSM 2782 TaxID=588581 RepID=F1TCJ4_9FIRM|nr:SH3 domain-containing C40 family peptidase [Ruminiclostridium papyrosolvens]EGD47711.1 NLP/P60 protein [Ruminiclostridium papyrosolvens DSM 2782]WES34429.1 SH3 domain-containing C40 family peptidase [Ruminiclostridium papyrosolvens DSM 2782]
MRKRLFIYLVAITAIFILTGCGNTEIPVTKNEQYLSGITADNAAVINDAVVDVFGNNDVLSTRVTQALFNQIVKVISQESSWAKIMMLDGTTGWVKSKYISRDTSCVTDGRINNKIVVTAKTVYVYTGTLNDIKYKQVVLGTELYSINKTKTGYDVLLPDNKKGWVEDGGVIAVPSTQNVIPKTSAEGFIQTVRKFEGTIYIIGGVSRWGIDSPGLCYVGSRINGVDIPRNVKEIAKTGISVKLNDIKPGDLLMFSVDNIKKDVSDVGVYTGNNEFIHSSPSRGVVTDSLEDSYYKNRIIGIRRIF